MSIPSGQWARNYVPKTILRLVISFARLCSNNSSLSNEKNVKFQLNLLKKKKERKKIRRNTKNLTG